MPARFRLPRQPKEINMQLREGIVCQVPPGQFVTEKFPVLSYGPTPQIDLVDWRLRVFGLVSSEVTLDWEQLIRLSQTVLTADFHCVTRWSRLENLWEGVAFQEIVKLAQPMQKAGYIMAHCYGGYTTNLSLEVAADPTVLLAHSHDGKPLEPEHGGPVRLLVPKRYGWKSAKWLSGIEFMEIDSPGFWEQRGYHMNGDFWTEERFGPG
jgi:DMSO/TMAO reductase YedYZ molybdopterin-dependent catalytic subunit